MARKLPRAVCEETSLLQTGITLIKISTENQDKNIGLSTCVDGSHAETSHDSCTTHPSDVHRGGLKCCSDDRDNDTQYYGSYTSRPVGDRTAKQRSDEGTAVINLIDMQ